MRIVSFNVNGIRAILKKGFLDWVYRESPDVLCLQETKASPDQLSDDVLNPEGYTAYWNSGIKPGYSGVATFTKIKPIDVKFGIGIRRFDQEGRIIETKFKDFTLFNVYFPNGQMSEERLQYKLDFYAAFFTYCENLREDGEELIITGDFNTAHKEIDLANPGPNSKRSGFLPIEREWLDRIVEMGYIDTFRYFHPEPGQYTWWTYRFKAREKNIGWRIDYFFVTEGLINRVKDSIILKDVYGSDHAPIMLIIE